MKSINKTSAVIIAVILAAVASLAFLLVEVTALFIATYVFTLIAIVVFMCGNLFLLSNTRTYPWGAALPHTTAMYLAVEFVISALAVTLEQTANIAIPVTWFAVAQCVVFAAFAVRIIALNAGRFEIERVEAKVKANTSDWKLLINDLEALAAKSPAVKPVLDAVKYSDPVTTPELAEYDAKIREDAVALENAVNTGEAGETAELVASLQRSVAARNARAKILNCSSLRDFLITARWTGCNYGGY